MEVKNSKLFLKGVIVLLVISLNFILLNKVTKHSNSVRSIEKNMRFIN